ncbi:hypothetical protein [Caballeronia glebae]|jgi:hypothetical protein|uniref:Transcriptional regulator n=1 Tax=Caballeronia glebae TaxID=1777143 RepID=A0A158DFJ3_9BURK|nr:hypothetical protein [Caballeronia glebae]SAK93359.1 transcriptional regulator [Caballeronia glebae]
MTSLNQYRGYTVQASAHRLRDKTFSANLLLERSSDPMTDAQYRFYALDYFSKESEAIEYSRRWAREWIDTRG